MKNIYVPAIDSSLEIWYSYLLDTNNIIVDNVRQVLELFDYVHKCVCNLILTIENCSLIPPAEFIKCYFKFRHNCFSAIYLLSADIGLSEYKLGTDTKFPYINSNRTPDFIYIKDNKIHVREFAVTMLYSTGDYNKGGYFFGKKYQAEIDELTNLGYLCDYENVILALKEPDFDYITSIDEFKNIYNFKKNIDSFKNSCLTHYEIIYKYVTSFNSHESNCNFVERSNNIIKKISNKGRYSIKFDYVFGYVNNLNIFSHNDYSSLIDDARRLKEGKYLISITYKGKPKFYKSIKGIDPLLFIQILEVKDFTLVLDFIRFDFNDNSKIVYELKKDINYIELSYIRSDAVISLFSVKNDAPQRKKNIDINYKNYGLIYGYTKRIPDYHDPYLPSNIQTTINNSLQPDKLMFNFDYKRDLIFLKYNEIIRNDASVSNKMLCNNKIADDEISNALAYYNNLYIKENANFVFKPKQSFIYPIFSSDLSRTNEFDLNVDFVQDLLNTLPANDYTKHALRLYLSGKFVNKYDLSLQMSLDGLKREYNEYNTLYYREAKKYYPDNIPKSAKILEEHPDLLKYFSELNKSRVKYLNALKTLSNKIPIRTVKINTSKKSIHFVNFQNEMKHFGQESGTKVGAGMKFDYYSTSKIFKDFHSYMMQEVEYDYKEPLIIDNLCHPFLFKLKQQYIEQYSNNDNFISKTRLMQSLFFIQKFCLTLIKLSISSFNKNYITFDNLGVADCIVMVRGGKKMHSTQKSKLCRLVYKVDDELIEANGWKYNHDFMIISIKGYKYVITPWLQFKDSVLYDGVSLIYRFRNFYHSLSSRCNVNLINKLTNFLPVILAFSNRRKTEGFMHNLRYLIVNILGDYSSLYKMMETFAGFNYTLLDCYLREAIKNNYYSFYKKMISFKDLSRNLIHSINEGLIINFITTENLTDIDELTIMIYSTYLMTKAPVEKSVEQANNLLPILQDVVDFRKHENCDSTNDSSLCFDVRDVKILPDDDFSYDPIFMQFLGLRSASRLKQYLGESKIVSEWYKILSGNIIDIANANGLRGFNSNNFFGKKGYEVVADFIREKISTNDLKNLLDKISNNDEINVEEERLFDFINDIDIDKLVLKFHVVEKIQRGLGREIFVMDIYTKLLQNPIEKMFAFFCKCYQNEIISVPSNKRGSLIHSYFFEANYKRDKNNTDLYNFVLDCKRWAPHSVLQKYMNFIYPMLKIFPKGFSAHLVTYLDLMINKKVFITREHAVKVLLNNKAFKDLDIEFLKGNYANDDWSFVVKFSFVMGIHNYLSSMVHAENQMLISEILSIRYRYQNKYVNLRMIAHSDDSAGQLITDKHVDAKEIIGIYEILLKSANHMLSIKKSQVNKDIYFEFLSTLYLKDRLLPVTTKFLCGMSYVPSDKGLGADLTFAASQSIELLQNGANLFESYIAFKLAVNLVYTYYGFDKPIPGIPFQLGGIFDPHPVELLISGTDCEMLRLIRYNENEFKDVLHILLEKELIDMNDQGNLNVIWDMGFRRDLKLLEKFNIIEHSFLESWTISNYKFKDPKLSLLWFIAKLKDRNFYSSLLNIPNSFRIGRMFGSFRYRNIISKKGILYKFIDVFNFFKDKLHLNTGDYNISDYKRFLEITNSNLINFWDSLPDDFEIMTAYPHSNKPLMINLRDLSIRHLTRLKAIDYTIYKKEKHYFHLINARKDTSRYFVSLDKVLDDLRLNIDSLGPSDLYKTVNKLLTGGIVSYRLIQPISSTKKLVNDFTGLLDWLIECAIPNKKLITNYKKVYMVDAVNNNYNFKVPSQVMDYIELTWLTNKIQASKVDYNLFFKVNPFELLEDVKKSLDYPWSNLVRSPISFKLDQLNYWHIWTKDQKRISGRFEGEGILVVKIEELLLELHVVDKNLELLIVREPENLNQFTGPFNIMSTWYLKTFICDLVLIDDMVTPDTLIQNKKYFGLDYDSNYCYDFPSNLMLAQEKTIEKMITTIDPYLDQEVVFNNNTNKYIVGNRNIFFTDLFKFNRVIKIDEYINMNALCKYLHLKSVNDLLRSVAKIDIPVCIDKENLIENFDSSVMYKIFYNFIDNDLFKDLKMTNVLLNYKELNPDFGFPDRDELLRYYEGNINILTPDFVLNSIREGRVNVTEELFHVVKDFAVNKICSETDKLLAYYDLKNLFGDNQLVNSLTIRKNKSSTIIYNFKFLKSPNLTINLLSEFYKILMRSLKGNSKLKSTQTLIHIDQNDYPKYVSIIFAITIYDIIHYTGDYLPNLLSWSNFFSNIWDLVCSDLIEEFKMLQDEYQYFSLIDFNVPQKDAFEFFIDLFAETRLNYMQAISGCKPQLIDKREIALGTSHYCHFNFISDFMQLDFVKAYNKINFFRNNSLWRTSNNWAKFKYGLFQENGYVLDDEEFDEYYGTDILIDADIPDNLLGPFDDVEKDLSFCFLDTNDLSIAVQYRGFSKDMIIISRCDMELDNYNINLYQFDPCIDYQSITLNIYDKLILKTSFFYTTYCDDGIKILNEDQKFEALNYVKFESYVNIQDEEVSRFKLWSYSNKKIDDIKRFFDQHDDIDLLSIALYKTTPENLHSGTINKLEKSLLELEPEEPQSIRGFEDVINKFQELLTNMGDSILAKLEKQALPAKSKLDIYREEFLRLLRKEAKSPTNLITDLRLISEENTLLPGLLEILAKNENNITESMKRLLKRDINAHLNKIKESHKYIESRGRYAYLCFLNFLVENCNVTRQSNVKFIDFLAEEIEKFNIEFVESQPNAPPPKNTELKYELKLA